jgi:WhiB family redox-sensing transcriptional regulator
MGGEKLEKKGANMNTKILSQKLSLAKKDNWMDCATCVELPHYIFFAEDRKTLKKAKAICAVCPVKEECLEYALDTGGYPKCGIMGGLTALERAALRKKRKSNV